MSVQAPPDQLAATIDTVRDNLRQAPEPPIATFAASSSLGDNYQTSVSIRDFTLTVDEPPTIGGEDTGPTPVELVLAALGTCQEIVYATYARVRGIPLDSVRVHAEGRLDLRGFYGVADVPSGFQDVTFTVEVDSPASPEQIVELVAEVNTHCPVLEILRSPVATSGTYIHNGQRIATHVA
jgi:uncharacterized OsmC-like protein